MKNLPDKNFSKSKENVTLNQNNLETHKYQMKVTMLDFYNIISNTFLEIRSSKNLKKINETITNVFTSSKTTDEKIVFVNLSFLILQNDLTDRILMGSPTLKLGICY